MANYGAVLKMAASYLLTTMQSCYALAIVAFVDTTVSRIDSEQSDIAQEQVQQS